MGKISSLSKTKTSQIVILSKEGYLEPKKSASARISAKIRCSKTAVHTAIANFNNYESYKQLNISGRPMKHPPR